ncbi:phage holin family protein [Hydrogenispora ethanolica]|uniref:phage holin family protein n=1 Tax=Hydrogenispora ethanolica TaxID=1082276 RepID=UPI002436B408|nr:phage holin family protein [Hydrogenispora ethanolica]
MKRLFSRGMHLYQKIVPLPKSGIILGVVNLFIRPLLLLVMLPFNLITMGLLTFVMNTWMIMLTDSMLKGLKIPGFWLTLLVSLIISIINIILRNL